RHECKWSNGEEEDGSGKARVRLADTLLEVRLHRAVGQIRLPAQGRWPDIQLRPLSAVQTHPHPRHRKSSAGGSLKPGGAGLPTMFTRALDLDARLKEDAR